MAIVLPILQYHEIGPKESGPRFSRASVPADAFRAQVDWLRAHGWRAVTLAEAFGDGPSRAHPKRVVLTFDDGYAGVLDHAAPVLAEAGWPATVFCAPGWMDRAARRTGPAGGTVLSLREADELVNAGWEIGAHTLHHADLPTLPAEAQTREIREGRDQLRQALGREIVTFAYPHGRYTDETERIVRASGFRCAVAVAKGNRHRLRERFRLRRVFMRPDTVGGTLAHRLGPVYDAWHRLRERLGRE